MKYVLAVGGMAFAMHAVAVRAQSLDVPESSVVVTATRTARTADESLAAVTVITRDDIERLQVRSVHELLRGLPGLSISNNGGPGKLTSVFLRGAESDHVLVLINGIKAGSATAGTTAFQDIPVDQIERIEVVRGPRSSLYGSEAVGGVIQIFTRRGSGPLAPSFALGSGSHHTYNATAGVSAGGERTSFNASLSVLDTNGFNACRGEPGVAGCFTNEPDDDGYRNVGGSLQLGYRLGGNSDIDLHWLRAEGDNEFDGTSQNESETVQQVYGGRLRFAPARWWAASLTAGRSQDESDNFKDGTFVSRFDTIRDSLSLQNDFTVGANQIITAGVDYQNDEISSTVAFPVTSRDNEAAFAQYQGTLRTHDFEASLRHDDNEQFGSHTTGGAAWGYRVADNQRLTVSYGTAFRAPTFNELYFPGFSNPNLGPEKSKSIEIGFRSKAAWGVWSVSTFQTRVDDLIAFDISINAPANVEVARIRGVEAVFATSAGGWDINTTATWLDPENRSQGASAGKTLPRRTPRALRTDIDRAFGRFRGGMTVLAEDRRFDDLANTRRVSGFALVDLRGEYAVRKNWQLQARVGNLFDKDYETAAFFNQPGREFFFTLRYQPANHQ